MVNYCSVPGCSSRSDRESSLSFHTLPLKNKILIKKWIHQIGCKSLPLNNNTRVCSKQFINSQGHCLHPDEFPFENLPALPTQLTTPTPRRPLIRKSTPSKLPAVKHVAVNTDPDGYQTKNDKLELELSALQKGLHHPAAFSIEQIAHDDHNVSFYTGFLSFKHLEACFHFLGPAKYHLEYRDSIYKTQTQNESLEKRRGRPRSLTIIDELILVLVRLKLGLLEEDLAFRFQISQPKVSRIFTTWVNFLYHQLKQIPLWPPKDVVSSNMPSVFKQKYPTTRVIIDATEFFIERSCLPDLQQRTFSNYKNHNTYVTLHAKRYHLAQK